MINVWQLLIFFAMIYTYSRSVEFTSSFFSKHHINGVRLSHRYRTEESASLLSCCTLCHGDSSCRSVSYHFSTGLCELNDNNNYEDSDSVKEDGWTTYNRDCPGGWKHHGGSCYYFDKEEVNWHTALMECRNKGGYLAEINSETENTFIKEEATFIGEPFIWIGGSDEEEEGTWTWVSSGSKISSETFQDWRNGEPNGDTSEQCLCYYQYGWIDFGCQHLAMYVCEK